MKIAFSDHALEQLIERRLSKKTVSQTVRSPLKIIKQTSRRYQAVQLIRKRRKQYLLVVIYDSTREDAEVVTAFITSKIKKYL